MLVVVLVVALELVVSYYKPVKSSFAVLQVVRVPTYSPNSVAEHAVSLLMALNR